MAKLIAVKSLMCKNRNPIIKRKWKKIWDPDLQTHSSFFPVSRSVELRFSMPNALELTNVITWKQNIGSF